MRRVILINLLIFIFLYLILEIFTGSLIYKHKLDCHYLKCNRTLVYKNVFIDNDKVIYKIDKYGFRGLRNNLDKIDFLVVGGSTSDQQFMNLDDTWPELIEKKFKEIGKNIDVVNAGKGGQSTVGHIWNFNNWFGKIENFRTKYIIFFIGINEVDVKGTTYTNIGKDGDRTQKKNILDKLITVLKDNNGITYKLVKLLYNKHFLKNVEIVKYKIRNKNDYKKIKKKLNLTKEHETHLHNNLQELVRLTNKIKATPIFITQKSFRGNLVDSTVLSIDEFDYYHTELEIAKIIINFCKKNNIFCIDLHNAIKFEYDDFYDLLHTTKKGTKKIAELIFLEINNHKPNLFE